MEKGLSPEDFIQLELFKKAVDLVHQNTELSLESEADGAFETNVENVARSLTRVWNKINADEATGFGE